MAQATRIFLSIISFTVASSFQFAPRRVYPRHAVSVHSEVERRSFLQIPFSIGVAAAINAISPDIALAGNVVTTASGLQYEVISPGKGQAAAVGDLCAVRFQGQFKGVVFDDILNNPEPYYFRVGSNKLLKGIEEAVQVMPIGARYKLTIPSELAFGTAGRGASPGKPRIPPGASVEYILELTALPGKEEDLIEIIGDV
mmetsp:Transcript_48400/g.97386  ORF Transcript_48400/g.97386 Transcript_48400/m.97386 type:complete len:199 (-) Transcript_48400:176-772(-)